MASARKQKPKGAGAEIDPAVVANRLKRQGFTASLAVVLGSGFQAMAETLPLRQQISYSQLEGFPTPSVPGHSGRLVLTQLGPVPALLLCGRAHYYEGLSMSEVTFPIRVLAALGVRDLCLTNAAGGITRQLNPGDLMLLRDHINWMGLNPLRGLGSGAERFVDLSEVYDLELRKCVKRAAKSCRIAIKEGTYLAVCGPSYETPAEIRAFARLGADAVGMSTVPEAVTARQCGLRVVALSCITNRAAGQQVGRLNHREVLERAQRTVGTATELLRVFGGFYAEMR